MNRILLIGAGPLAIEPGVASGPSIRATQFYLALRDAGHEVRLAALAGPRADGRSERALPGGGGAVDFSPEALMDGEPLRAWAQRLRPQAIVGCGTILASAAAARLGDLAPAWIDLFGDPIAELQSKVELASGADNDAELLHVWRLMQTCLRRGDAFSSLSSPQGHAIVGALGLLGRLTKETAGRPLVWPIPCAILPHDAVTGAGGAVFRGRQCAADSFLAVWSGSYNTWIDPEMLFNALALAMAREPRLRFVSTGGGSAGYNESIYEDFRARATASLFAERFHFLGWLPRAEAEAIHRECDVGLNVDRWTYEGALGSRNRIINFLDLGVPVATTVLSEISRELNAAGGVIGLSLNDPEGMADTLCALARAPERLRDSAARGQAFVRETYSIAATTRPLVAWSANPERAGDWGAENRRINHVKALTDFETFEALLRKKDRVGWPFRGKGR